MKFPEIQTIMKFASSDYERDFVQDEYKLGLQYYLDRLDRIFFTGQAVLDAGCGVGQWSIALSQRFEKVAAIDLKPERLTVLENVKKLMDINNIEVTKGSIEQLPYEDKCFDAVFCYGVIMFTDTQKVLKEFYRVLKPGGRVYICLNDVGWSFYLVEVRGKDNENISRAGKSTLYNTFWKRAIKKGIISDLQSSYSFCKEIMGRCTESLTYDIDRELYKWLISHSHTGNELLNYISQYCGEDYVEMLVADVSSILKGENYPSNCQITRAISPVELEEETKQEGFIEFQWSTEGNIVCDWLIPSVKPKYEGYYKRNISVWECIFAKPGDIGGVVTQEYFTKLCRSAMERPVYIGSSDLTVLSNGSRYSYPLSLLQYAKILSARIGGANFLKKLTKELVKDADSDEEIYKAVISFVQRSIFRDPVAQPVNEDGSLPDSLTTLFCARGRCGHVSLLLVDMFTSIGFDARLIQLPKHVAAEVKIDGRWVIADADIFKHGIIPYNKKGKIISMEDIQENPYQLDIFPATGWFIRPNSRYVRGALGCKVIGYVDALEPEKRGFISGYYSSEAEGYPPSIPEIEAFKKVGHNIFFGRKMLLQWAPSRTEDNDLLYRVCVGTKSREWTYDDLKYCSNTFKATSCDVLMIETKNSFIEFNVPNRVKELYAAVTAVNSRVNKEPDTYFWPSEEVKYVFGK